jgi:small-conductance mechanosensitive channel
MMEFIDRPLTYLMGLEATPGWLKAILPQVWHFFVAALIMVLGYFVALTVKAIIKWWGSRRLKKTDRAYEGSKWDLLDSAIQALVVLAFVPIALTVIGVDAGQYLSQNSGGIISALVILTVAVMLSRWLSSSIKSFGQKAQMAHRGDGTLFMFLGALVSYLVIGFALVLSLTQLGVQSASLIALVGAAGLAIALALQDTLKAVASGVMLAIFRPYRIGDWVNVAGMEGEVTDITPFRTTIKPPTNQAVSLPNDQVWTNPISNSSRFARRRLDLYLDVSYEDDVDKAIQVTLDAVNALSRTLAKPETWVGVHAFRDSSVQLRCRVWVAMPEYVQMRSDCLRAIKAAYAQNDISIPYPHQVEIQRPYKPAGDMPEGEPNED